MKCFWACNSDLDTKIERKRVSDSYAEQFLQTMAHIGWCLFCSISFVSALLLLFRFLANLKCQLWFHGIKKNDNGVMLIRNLKPG